MPVNSFMVPPPIKMKKRVSEAQIESYLRKQVVSAKGECYKWTSPNVRGVFDRVCVFPGGDVWFVEVKAPDGRMSSLQERFYDRMAELGMKKIEIVWCKDDVDEFIKEATS